MDKITNFLDIIVQIVNRSYTNSMFPRPPCEPAPPSGQSAKRLSILEAAAHVFCREGYAGASFDMIALEAGVSRQTVYNHHGDKERLLVAVVREIGERVNAEIFETLATFPDKPADIAADLTAFAIRLTGRCQCSRDGRFIRRLIQNEAERHPHLFEAWKRDGQARTTAALAARFARLALAGHLRIEDPDLAARQFLALVNADLQPALLFGQLPDEATIRRSAESGVGTFLRAFGPAA